MRNSSLQEFFELDALSMRGWLSALSTVAEERVINRHIDELKAGHVIVAIAVPQERVRRLVHFGPLTVTWHTK